MAQAMGQTPTRSGKARNRAHTEAKQPASSSQGKVGKALQLLPEEDSGKKRARTKKNTPSNVALATVMAPSLTAALPTAPAGSNAGLLKSLCQRARRSLCQPRSTTAVATVVEVSDSGEAQPAPRSQTPGAALGSLRPGGLLEAMRRRGTLPVLGLLSQPILRAMTPTQAMQADVGPAAAIPDFAGGQRAALGTGGSTRSKAAATITVPNGASAVSSNTAATCSSRLPLAGPELAVVAFEKARLGGAVSSGAAAVVAPEVAEEVASATVPPTPGLAAAVAPSAASAGNVAAPAAAERKRPAGECEAAMPCNKSRRRSGDGAEATETVPVTQSPMTQGSPLRCVQTSKEALKRAGDSGARTATAAKFHAGDTSPALKGRLPQSSPRGARPPVPSFGAAPLAPPPLARCEPEPWLTLRDIKLPPRKPEDNYEISDKGEDSDAEEPDRSEKHVPRWSNQYLELIEKQAGTDPDTIFGTRVPRCQLEIIFSDALYARCNKERPKRKRGSSGEWKQDRLSKVEVHEYKRKMGHSKRWTVNAENTANVLLAPSSS
eukprot:CAMPEP_0171073274 /NCGR_PEP_ID=MMETSP0766_2-20121228/11400_1 /TAXON_ID=439317 /ORGANISM="Gambierdiscus australes, Strain CAWD 149" /LENGTH=548 /DNA_ID=CAMNT_0011529947 /DNA_START=1 /DNA_END=1647 /DNA_ORIENTATION=-